MRLSGRLTLVYQAATNLSSESDKPSFNPYLALPSVTMILLSASGTPKLLSNTQMRATYGERCFSGWVKETFIALISQNLPTYEMALRVISPVEQYTSTRKNR